MGLSSNFAPFCEIALSGSIGASAYPADNDAETRLDATCAAGTIRRRLNALPSHEAGVLFAAFEPRVWPSRLEQELGPLTGIAVRLTMAGVGFAKDIRNPRHREEAAAAWLDETLEEEGALAVCLVRAEAQALFTRALRAYARVRGAGPSVVPGR
jgi:hypothetical protein